MLSIITSIVRHILSFLSGSLAIEGLASDANVQIIASALILVGTVAWSVIERKFLNKDKEKK